MTQPLLANIAAAGNIMPLIAMAALVIGGLGLIMFSMRMRAQALGRRVDMVQSWSSAASTTRATALPEDYQFKPSTQGLTVPEQQQIARIFLKLNVMPDRAVVYFTVCRLILTAGAGLVALLAVSTTSRLLPVLIAFAAAIIGWFLPIVVVRMKLKKHRKAVGAALPDALELLAICVDAGISLESGLQRIGTELRDSQPALAGELRLTWAEISILPSRDLALANLAERVNLPSLRSFVGALSQSLRFGTPLAQSLRGAAAEMRNDLLLKLEERANRLPALLTVPVMLLIMPTIFLIVGGPAVLRIMEIFGFSASPH